MPEIRVLFAMMPFSRRMLGAASPMLCTDRSALNRMHRRMRARRLLTERIAVGHHVRLSQRDRRAGKQRNRKRRGKN